MNRALRAYALLSACLLVQAAAQTTPPTTAQPPTAQPPTAQPPTAQGPISTPSPTPSQNVLSQSSIRLSLPRLDLRSGQSLVLAQRLVVAGGYQPGSSALNGVSLPDPLLGPGGTLYWTLDAETLHAAGTPLELRYRVGHSTPLPALPPVALRLQEGNAGKTLSGLFNEQDFAAATPLVFTERGENAGAIKLPLDGVQVRGSDQITVEVEVPTGSDLHPRVNGQALDDSHLGETTPAEEGRERRRYYAVLLRPGTNSIELGAERITVPYAGTTTQYRVEPLSLVADGSTPLRLKITALDAAGLPTEQPTLTLQSSLEPLWPDARPGELGYQLALQDGVGVLELRPQNTPTSLKLELALHDRSLTFPFEVQAGRHAVGVGLLSATLGLGSPPSLTVQARAYFEGPLGKGMLYLAADRDGLPRREEAEANTPRYLTYGDASRESVPLQATGPLAFTYEHPQFRVAYRQGELPLEVVPMPTGLTALSATTRGDTRMSGFAALLPGDLIREQELTPNGTRLLYLPHQDITPDSETLSVITLDSVSGTVIERRALQRQVDYTLDPQSGVVTLALGLAPVDEALRPLRVQASYRLNRPQERQLAYGVQVETVRDQARFGVAAVHLDGVTTYGVAGRYATPQLQAGARVLLSGGVHAEAQLNGRWQATTASLNAYYQSVGYAGLGDGGEGTRLKGELSTPITERVKGELSGAYAGTDTTRQGEATALARYRQDPFSVGAGVRYSFGDRQGLSLVGSAGYERGNLTALFTHSQPVTGTVNPVSEVRLGVPLGRALKLDFTDRLEWSVGHTAALSLNSMLGRTNYAMAYELPNAGGSGNRARFGVSTSWPLSERTSLDVRAAYVQDLSKGSGVASSSLNLAYRVTGLTATLGTDLSYDTGAQSAPLTTVLHGGLSGDLTPKLNLSASGTAQFGPQPGMKLSTGYAYRSPQFSSLGYLRLTNGTLGAGQPQLVTGASAEYRYAPFSVRGGVDARMNLNDPDSFTYQPQLGLTVKMTDRLRVGAWGRALIQPATQSSVGGYGLEAGVKTLPGVWLSAGYNFQGFAGIAGSGLNTAGLYTQPGAYLRLDLTLDETLNGVKR